METLPKMKHRQALEQRDLIFRAVMRTRNQTEAAHLLDCARETVSRTMRAWEVTKDDLLTEFRWEHLRDN